MCLDPGVGEDILHVKILNLKGGRFLQDVCIEVCKQLFKLNVHSIQTERAQYWPYQSAAAIQLQWCILVVQYYFP